jgi:hypothetical protein
LLIFETKESISIYIDISISLNNRNKIVQSLHLASSS